MKPDWLLPFIVFWIFLTPLKSYGFNTNTPELAGILNPATAERIILVGFPDQSFDRVQSASTTSYRRRGDYQSSTWSQRISSQIADDYHLQKLTEWPMTEVGVHCVVYQVPAEASIADTLKRMAQDKRIAVAQKMNQFRTRARQYNDPYFKLQANMQQMQIDQVHNTTTGRGVTIAMIDTGVDLTHPDLIGQITQNENFADSVSPDFSNDKHGTAVAGVMVARKDNATGIIGVAPDAKLIALKACWPDKPDSIEAVCNSFTLALAVNSAIKSGAQILNMSLTGPNDPLLEILLNKAIDKGMVIVAANTGLEDNENFPASLANVISVQSSKQADSVKSERAIIAPSENILTTLPHGTYDFISGSSIAAAEVSGLIALLLQINPDMTLAETRLLLQQSELSGTTGFSGINANTALLALCKTIDCPQETLNFARK